MKTKNVLLLLLVGVMTIGIGIIIYFMAQNEMSTRENTLFNVMLALFSSLASVIVSHLYFEASKESSIEEIKKDYKDNLKLYAQKALEKVRNLSNELGKLSVYLEETEYGSDTDESTALLIQQERNRGAIHIVQTLKSINDRSVSDWSGVIPQDEIDEQNENQLESTAEFTTLLDNYRLLIKESKEEDTSSYLGEQMHDDIAQMNKKIDSLATNILGTPIGKGDRMPRVTVKKECPNCNQSLTYRQRNSETSRKSVVCPECKQKFRSSWNEKDGFILSPQAKGESVYPKKVAPEELIEIVKKEMPSQPWDKGASKILATKLRQHHADVDRAVQELIKRGVFKMQIDGVLYEPIEKKDEASEEARI